LAVQDVLSIYTGIDSTTSSPTMDVLVELLTSDGLLILQIPKPMARELGESVSRISLEPDHPSEHTLAPPSNPTP